MNLLAIDQGTSATKALVVSTERGTLAEAEVAVHPAAAPGGGVEQDPEELYRSVVEAGRRALAAAGERVAAVGFANQGETVLAWDRASGRPLSTALSWQDRRAASVCERLADRADRLRALTGLPLDPYFAAPKLTWLREHLTTDGVRDVGLVAEAADLDRLGLGVDDTAGVTFVPGLAGLGAPFWRPNARGAFVGLSLGSGRAHLVRAVCEASRPRSRGWRGPRATTSASRWSGCGSTAGSPARGCSCSSRPTCCRRRSRSTRRPTRPPSAWRR
jgi:glycerol kinase